MRKVLATILIILAAVTAGASFRALFSKTEEPVPDTLYDAIPLDAGLIVDIRDYGELCRTLRENGLWNILGEISSVGNLNGEMQMLDSLVQKYEQAAPLRNNILFSFHPVGKEEMQSIGYVRTGNDKEARALADLLKGQLSGKAVVSQRLYDQVNITDVVFNDKKQQSCNFSCACRGGIFIFSRSSILLEHAIRQIAADSNIADRGKLAELMHSAGKNAPANIYVNYRWLPRTALTVFHARNHQLIEPLARFADWTELDLNIKPDLFLFNGFTACGDASDHWFETFLSQPAIPAGLTDAMPSTAYAFLWLGIRQIQQYFTDYGRYLDLNRESDYKKELARLQTSFRVELQKDFAERFEDEAALVYANVGQTQSKDEPFALFRIKSASSAISMIEEWQDAVEKSKTGGTDKKLLAIDNQLTFTAYRLPFDVPAALFGDIFAGGNQWCVVADNYLVFGSSPTNLQKYLHYTALHATLQTDPGYGKLANLFSTRSNLMFYCHPAQSGGLFENALKSDRYRETQQAPDALSQMQAMAYQLSSAGGKLYNTFFLKYSSAEALVASGTQTSWESLLDTAISFKPQLIQNHSTGETDIFVQDMANNACLLNNAGRILWKVKLPEPIISPVYQVDIYRNGKLQMLFNTKSHLYVIDRLGNFVDNFPVALNSPAVGSVALFDYDSNRQYRMMVACEDRKVYAFDRTGKPVDGWSFKQSEHPAQTDIYHFRTENKDYIVFADKYRVYILDRQGRTRVSPEHNLPVGRQTSIALDQQRARLALTDTAGTVHFISLANGSMTRQIIKPYPSSHLFVFQDVDGDGQGDFIFASGNKLEVFRQDTQQIINIETEEPISMRPYVYEFAASDLRIGIVQPQNNRIWLYDNRGKASKGFPLKGSTLFSIGRPDKSSNNFNLLVGSKNNFLYNYSVYK
ncbi:MAG: PQQ-like beta-propeller repeat protein [Prevotellaceae bacterium]|jgi:hypothetical protein|nr:PQQ-like beta-propeller repeat protein [Prevotellaceae bacterium]